MTPSSRRHRISFTFGVLTVAALALPGVVRGAGLNLSWDDCGTAGTANQTFACATNTGAAVLIGSFIAPSGLTQLVGIAATLEVWTSADSLPSWWQLGASGCREGRLSASFDFVSGPYTCLDLWNGAATGGRDYNLDSLGAQHARLRVVAAVSASAPIALEADQEYYAFKLVLSYQKTTGTGACAGCGEPVSIALSSLRLAQPAGVGDVVLTDPASSNVVKWQGGAGDSYGGARAPLHGQIRSLLR